MMSQGTTLLQGKLKDWLTCTRCPLQHGRRQVVLGRGTIPAEILFVGEAPGKSEDLMGEAFVGRSGRILEEAIADAAKFASRATPPSYYISNVVACVPLEEGKIREPDRKEELACWKRLELTQRLVAPDHIVLLGSIAAHACAGRFHGTLNLRHPAYILRQGGTSSTEYRTFVRELTDLFKRAGRPTGRLQPKDMFGDDIK